MHQNQDYPALHFSYLIQHCPPTPRALKAIHFDGLDPLEVRAIARSPTSLRWMRPVEAVRAGDEGRGFAVVAGEVRPLAQRSVTAVKDIKELISSSVSKVDDGTGQIGVAKERMRDIV